MQTKNAIVELTIEFALKVIDYTELLEEKRKFIIAKQLLKAGTSIEANVHEDQSAESRADFIHKLKILAKEANEIEYWLKLCTRAKSYQNPLGLIDELISIQKLLGKIISTAKNPN